MQKGWHDGRLDSTVWIYLQIQARMFQQRTHLNICFIAIFRWPSGSVLALQTDKNHRGCGYGTLVTRAYSKQIAEMGRDVYAGVYKTNAASRALFERLGFELTTLEKYWIFTWNRLEKEEPNLVGIKNKIKIFQNKLKNWIGFVRWDDKFRLSVSALFIVFRLSVKFHASWIR